MNKNGNIYTRLKDSKGRFGTPKTIIINNIDTIQPNEFPLEVKKLTKSSVMVSGITEDTADEGSNVAGIRGYKYKLDDGEWTEEKTENRYTFEDLDSRLTHTVTMRAIDNAGNWIDSTQSFTIAVYLIKDGVVVKAIDSRSNGMSVAANITNGTNW